MNMPLVLLNRRRRGFTAFSPSTLFTLAEPGVWFDPSDLTTLYQDPAGTTPVTAPGNTVGLMLDKSKGLALGAELVANGDFSGGSTGWTYIVGTNNSASVVSGQLVFTSGTGPTYATYRQTVLTIGKWYQIEFDLIAVGGSLGNNIYIEAGGSGVEVGSTLGRRRLIRAAAGTNLNIIAIGGGTIDNISVRELAGNHATQATIAARPTYSIEPVGGRRNLLTWSEDFGNAVWLKTGATVPATQYLAPDGTTTADALNEDSSLGEHRLQIQNNANGITSGLSYTYSVYLKQNVGARRAYLRHHATPTNFQGAVFDLATGETSLVGTGVTATATDVGSGWWRFSISFVANGTGQNAYINLMDGTTLSYTGNGTSGILIWGAQLELGSTATNYQKVTTQHDVTEAGVASVGYLYFDGASDAMATSTITPGTDKVQVFAGVRKLNNSTGAIAEFSFNFVSGGAFGLFCEGGPGAANNYFFGSGGTAFTTIIAAPFVAPITNVVTGIGNISGDLAALRANGTQVAQSTTDQGTGNYLAHPLYLGGRAGTSLFLSGHLYSLITRFGPTLDAPTIASTETWVAGKTGVVI